MAQLTCVRKCAFFGAKSKVVGNPDSENSCVSGMTDLPGAALIGEFGVVLNSVLVPAVCREAEAGNTSCCRCGYRLRA